MFGIPSFGPSGYWCYTNQYNPTIPIIIIVLNFLIILTTLFCYIATLREVNFQQKLVKNLNSGGSRLSRIELVVARKITGYILMFILQWTPTMFYVVGQIFDFNTIWMYTLTEVFGNSGGIGNMILFLINEKWKDNFNSSAEMSNSNSKNIKERSISSEPLTEHSDECINNENSTLSRIKVHEIITIKTEDV
ncbi:9967_t:CDS:2 [Cetraspora pellucida]|uniref:9967_t:CDS:1 n=1 Tax=Cetraspora pellucida TaxID=1433469 RepID=A0A9N9IGI4_9GLOM|nr:9967_t:CDS:2 [Cetraspora pellucida]